MLGDIVANIFNNLIGRICMHTYYLNEKSLLLNSCNLTNISHSAQINVCTNNLFLLKIDSCYFCNIYTYLITCLGLLQTQNFYWEILVHMLVYYFFFLVKCLWTESSQIKNPFLQNHLICSFLVQVYLLYYICLQLFALKI